MAARAEFSDSYGSGDTSGAAGAGGNATSNIAISNSSASQLSVASTAGGGAGGYTDNGTAGAGGSATATVNATSTGATSQVGGAANATGGAGGYNYGTASYAAAGAATASSMVSANGVAGYATANATGGYSTWGANATATATVANASSGYAQATATSSGVNGEAYTQSTAYVGGGASATGMTGVTAGIPALLPIVAGSMAAQAYLTPTGATQAVGAMEAGYGGTGATETVSYYNTTEFYLPKSAGEEVYLSLLSSDSSGWTSATLTFDVYNSDTGWQYNTFTSLLGAQAYFNSNVLDLGYYGSGTTPFVELYYVFTSNEVGDGFGFNYALAETPISTTIPEASTWTMLILGFGGLGYAGWRRTRKPGFAAL